ncbi:MAG: cobalt/nickel transport system permease protein [Halanaerobium sp. 4-GBenrich]|jgi:energy-coupling factor transport system permease protein|uniref:Energy-coupling factor transport system permease protein n=1 Tax=Halanaerobium congolense TaxID=54121 RepID=A0A1G6Q416_9FIRM|nr:energy-coupling factor transporter transmembrane component T [Halanaerobium congolense]KXS48388.1 MAG: cobalt/nickel transport system permease protein [Halanaerobium sp. T82-1]ODS50770.1 MAG: cobalt/nickel transport system permease protein [Halanaerobium sp. 4-GBenrich]PUU92873.1 MAG: cobalt/nickel transport system permease protein [Halanaerobium sp.]PTX15529.1 energy-coupling factor transport system permease protein [Halanaerobium congolense]PXV63891.1 energy-coupling factor transport syst
MLKDITIGQYIARDSIIHALDARIKIMITTILIIALFTIDTFMGFGLFTAFVLGVILLSKISIKKVLKGLKPILILVLFTLFIHIFLTNGGEVLWSWKFISIESEGVYIGFFMVSRIFILILFTSLLTLTTSPLQLTDGIEYILSPLKRFGVPASELSMMMTIALRFIPTLLEEADKIMKAQQARGADFESGNLIQRAKSLIPLLVPLFISAFRRADDLALAMESRCYRGGEGRTRLHELEYKYYDFVALGMIIILAAAVSFY